MTLLYRNSDGVRRSMTTDKKDEVTVHTEVNLDQVVENNKIVRELQNPKSNFRLIARGVPLTVYEQSLLEGWDEKRWNRWLNDPDNKAFRIYGGWM